jgi:hypothetical protein
MKLTQVPETYPISSMGIVKIYLKLGNKFFFQNYISLNMHLIKIY